jgi:hypothetical protein
VSTLWHARVVELAGERAVIELSVAHPDAGPFNEDPIFGLRLLAEPALDPDGDGDEAVRGPLGDEVRFGEAESTQWCMTNAPRFIAQFRRIDPEPPRTGGNWRYAKGASVRYELIATDPRWLAHLATEQAWSSTVYS